MMKTKLTKTQIKKQFKDAEERVMKKIRLRMEVLRLDQRLRAKMEKDIRKQLRPQIEKNAK